MVIPATKFTATFSNIGYLGINRCLDKGKLNYSQVYIVQASDLKERIEELKVKRDKVTIASVDAISIYLSIKLTTIRKLVRFFARKLNAETKKTINLCLELIHFRMSSTIIYFDIKYYEYHGREREEQGLAIGEYESTFLADLVASYLFEKSISNFRLTICHGIYKDDGLVVLKKIIRKARLDTGYNNFIKQ